MDQFSPKKNKKLAIRLLIRVGILLFCALVISMAPRIFSWTAPFIIAFAVSYLLRPFVDKLHQHTKISWKILAFVSVITVYSLLFIILGAFIHTIISQAVSLAQNIQPMGEYINVAMAVVSEKLDWLLDYLPADFEAVLVSAIDGLLEYLQVVSGDFVNFILSKTVSFTSRMGQVFLDLVICIMATYFITAEYNKIDQFLKDRLKRGHQYFSAGGAAVKSALSGYFKAQFMLAATAFVVMFVALGLYGQEYSLLISLFLGIIDFLPIVGTAIVLIPWGLIHIIAGEMGKGFFLILLSGGFFLLRKFIEPKVVGSQTGLHPLAALMSIYLGMKLAGVWGAILGPVFLMIIINLIKSPIFDGTKRDFKAAFDTVAEFLK